MEISANPGGAAQWPARVAVIGGGRWARVIIQVLDDILPATTPISAHSLRGAEKTAGWIAEQGLGSRVQVATHWPQLPEDRSTAVVVANAAQDHERAIEWALSSGASVLVEKPMALTSAAAQRLVSLARTHQARFATAHVFLFARYVENFYRRVAAAGKIRSLEVEWMDPRVESRHGEVKRFNAGVPVFADWMPHVSSILGAVAPGLTQRCMHLDFHRGGADLQLTLSVGDIPCSVRLTRNGERRKRIFAADTAAGMLRLDFSVEPGTIAAGGTIESGDTDWAAGSTPLATLLAAFLQWAAGGGLDRRLDAGIGLHASLVIDQAAELYNSARSGWLAGHRADARECDDDLRYALSEIVQHDGQLAPDVLERRISELRQQFYEAASEGGT